MASELLRLLLLGVFAVTTVSITGCETTKGAGRDIENAGEAMDDAVDDDVDIDVD